MPLPSPWIDSLFARLAVRYGAAWLNLWNGLDIADVKADWAEELSGFAAAPEAIKHALANLPSDRPPTVGQFRLLCINRPVAGASALPAPKADPTVVATVLGAIKRPVGFDPKAWAWRLRAKEQQGNSGLTPSVRVMWRAALEPEIAAEARAVEMA